GSPEGIPFETTELTYEDGSKEIIGKEVTVEEVIQKILPYQRFSKGNLPYGVTLSGGEPTAQWNFYFELLKGLKYFNFPTAVETNGSSAQFITSLPYLDLIFCDIKHFNSEIHKKLMGKDNKQVLHNIKKTYEAGKDLWIEIPVIPGYNDSEENFQDIADFLFPMKDGLRVELLKYGRHGIYKWRALGKNYPLLHLMPPSNRKIIALSKIIKSKGIKVDIS
ncbi:radical SAM protein, partial [bacterium]|nr:radical SAM protein [bacterium]